MSSRAGLRVDMGIKYLYIIDTLSREISHRIGACPTESGDFSTTLRCGRNDSGAGEALVPLGLEISPLHSALLRFGRNDSGGYLCHLFLFPMTVKLAAYMSSRAGLRVDMKVKMSEIYCCSESRDLPSQWGCSMGREISPLHSALLRFGRNDSGRGDTGTIGAGDFSTPLHSALLRSGRNDSGAGSVQKKGL